MILGWLSMYIPPVDSVIVQLVRLFLVMMYSNVAAKMEFCGSLAIMVALLPPPGADVAGWFGAATPLDGGREDECQPCCTGLQAIALAATLPSLLSKGGLSELLEVRERERPDCFRT